jgi:hypothetical protein
MLNQPHYQLVASLRRSEDVEVIAQALDFVAHDNPTRAALILSDLYGLWGHTSFDHMRHNRESNEKLQSALNKCTRAEAIKEALLILPTIDARTCRDGLVSGDELEKSRFTAGAMYAVMRPEKLPESLVPLKKRLFGEYEAMEFCANAAAKSFAPLSSTPKLSPRHEELLSQFTHGVGFKDFQTDKYGYGHIHEKIHVGEKHKGVWTLKNLIGSGVDAPNGEAHQCVDSASAARSFFVSRGIPADVYSAVIGGMMHNVAVVFFPESKSGGRTGARGCGTAWYVPVVVDVSPIGGFYRIESSREQPGISFVRPLSITSVFNQRQQELPFVAGDNLSKLTAASRVGLLPWLAKDLAGASTIEGRGVDGCDRVVVFAGVAANQVRPSSSPGVPEYWGGGVRRLQIAFQATVMPGPNSLITSSSFSPFVEIEIEATDDVPRLPPGHTALAVKELPEDGSRLVASSFQSALPSSVVDEVMSIVQRELPQVRAFLGRIGFSMEQRSFGSPH